MQKKKKEFFSYHAYSRIKQNRVWNRIYYFKIAVFLNFEQGTSKSGKLKWKHRQTSLEFFHSWFSSFNWQKCGNVEIIFPVLYHIIHNSDLGQGKNQQIFHKIFHFFFNSYSTVFCAGHIMKPTRLAVFWHTKKDQMRISNVQSQESWDFSTSLSTPRCAKTFVNAGPVSKEITS